MCTVTITHNTNASSKVHMYIIVFSSFNKYNKTKAINSAHKDTTRHDT